MFKSTYGTNDFISQTLGAIDNLDDMRDTAQQIIEEKDAEIARLNREIEKAEDYLDQHGHDHIQEASQIKEQIERLSLQLQHIQLKTREEIEELRKQQEKEIHELEAKHQREIDNIHRDATEDQGSRNSYEDNQSYSSPRHRSTNKSYVETYESKVNKDPRIKSAKAEAEELASHVQELEAELAQLSKQQQENTRKAKEEKKSRIVQARAMKAQQSVKEKEEEYKVQFDDIKQKYEQEIADLENKLQDAIAQNDDLDKKLAKILASNQESSEQLKRVKNQSRSSSISKEPESPRRKGKSKLQVPKDFSFIEAEIIRIQNENEDLQKELKRLDKLAYGAHVKKQLD